MSKINNINKLFFIFLVFSINIFSAEVGGSRTGYFTSSLDSNYSNRLGRLFAPRPNYIWRDPFEDIVNLEVLDNTTIYGVKDPHGGASSGEFSNHNIQVTLGSSHPDIIPTFSNPNAPSGFTTEIETRNSDKSLHWELDIYFTTSDWISAMSDVNVSIPWSVPDGLYNLKYTRDFHTTNAGTITTNPNWISSFSLKTYLNVSVEDLDFGKVIFTPGANDVTKSSDIDIAGAANANIQITAPSSINLESPNNDYSIPVQITLNDHGLKGNQIAITTDNSGTYSLNLEATLMPGKYPDYGLYEGKYFGDVTVEFVYN